MPLLYHWQREQFLKDNHVPLKDAELNLSQNSPVLMSGVGERMWVFTRDCDDVYVLAGSLIIERVERTNHVLGTYTAFAKGGTTKRYRLVNPVVDVQPAIRALSISTDSAALGSSFQGTAAVRQISHDDDAKLEKFALALKPATFGIRWRPGSCK